MFKFFRLTFLRSIERSLAQWILVSSEPSAFLRERIHLGNTTNFLRAANFFISAISTALLAEVATLHLLGIGNLNEPYYWLFILLTSIPFVLICFLLARLVAPFSFRDVLHLSFYPIGAGVFTGAAFALVVSAVVALLVAVGFIPEIIFDLSQWKALRAVVEFNECLKQESAIYTLAVTGLGDAYGVLKPPINSISYLRPGITLLHLFIAARVFMAAADTRKWAVFGVVLLAAALATGANYLALRSYFDWHLENTNCAKSAGTSPEKTSTQQYGNLVRE